MNTITITGNAGKPVLICTTLLLANGGDSPRHVYISSAEHICTLHVGV
jgi:hypothetical protein